MSWSGWNAFTEEKINNVPEKSGVYELHTSNELLYIGQSDNIRRRLKEHLNSDDTCIKKTTVFRYRETSTPKTEEENLLSDYKKNHDGKLPPCNEQSK